MQRLMVFAVLVLLFGNAAAQDIYQETVNIFKESPKVQVFFQNAYGYAVFPTIGKGAVGIGGAHGKGRVYQNNRHIGDTSMTQLSFGWQLGGQAFSEVIFFQTAKDLERFKRGEFEFGAQASAVAITASANAKVGTTGLAAGASGTSDAAGAQTATYNNGVAVFTHAKGGLMYEAALSGQKFSYTPL
ncbi:lipid-binding SYLF domain-containing protein [Gilvimarinus algae]|uniref:Lipid-binding SYLF domain-containing protein n=1 Tax=Gilvimarinus algae TaxID=3058037 RepID=A0ABT8THV8_9GAMM|nr:lipid-binding SYLF domain-containing protein [Gilvimarinus sp. SDUM040014]MDO3383610.1 lipid-binding SYLF domain-containing protein [Gilvimarinus sp. SDUM040014]